MELGRSLFKDDPMWNRDVQDLPPSVTRQKMLCDAACSVAVSTKGRDNMRITLLTLILQGLESEAGRVECEETFMLLSGRGLVSYHILPEKGRVQIGYTPRKLNLKSIADVIRDNSNFKILGTIICEADEVTGRKKEVFVPYYYEDESARSLEMADANEFEQTVAINPEDEPVEDGKVADDRRLGIWSLVYQFSEKFTINALTARFTGGTTSST